MCTSKIGLDFGNATAVIVFFFILIFIFMIINLFYFELKNLKLLGSRTFIGIITKIGSITLCA